MEEYAFSTDHADDSNLSNVDDDGAKKFNSIHRCFRDSNEELDGDLLKLAYQIAKANKDNG